MSTETPPARLDAALIFAPVGALVPAALKAVRKGGRVVAGGIPSFPYADLWEERSTLLVANLTRANGHEFFPLAEKAGIRTRTSPSPFAAAIAALEDLRNGRLGGARRLRPVSHPERRGVLHWDWKRCTAGRHVRGAARYTRGTLRVK